MAGKTPNTPIGDAIANIGSTGEGFDVGVQKDADSGVGVSVAGNKALGKGWAVGGAVQWAKDSWSTFGGFSWRPKAKK